ncbi:MAG: excisionase family DNA-binding protein [Bacteroidetes bacterium]|nr:excisionase family DNA-binding protein [Bacteroidota bacterium]
MSSIESLKKREKQVLKEKKDVVKLNVSDTNESIEIPLKAFSLLKSIIGNMAEGKSFALILADAEMSTQQAANILKVSRPHFVKLLETSKIPFKKVGSHRRVLLKDVLNYETILKLERRKNLDFLAKEAQDLNLSY